MERKGTTAAKTGAPGRFLVGVGVLLWDPAAARYLLLRRAAERDFEAGHWECVTGRLEQGEGFEQAARRELREECGLAANLLAIVASMHFYRGPSRPEFELVGVIYLATIDGPSELRLSAEHSEARWLTASEARDLLAGRSPAEAWLLRLIARADRLRAALPAGELERLSQGGYELN
ncbi:MAG: NUDIX domain-containing protein [Candidatus Promineifilaceae bacterium]